MGHESLMQSGGSMTPDTLTLIEISLNGTEINEFKEFWESDKSLKHELGSI